MCKTILEFETSGKNSPRTNLRVLEDDPIQEPRLSKMVPPTEGNRCPLGGGIDGYLVYGY